MKFINPLYTGDSKWSTLANSADPDEMPHNVAFHQCLHCLLRRKENDININDNIAYIFLLIHLTFILGAQKNCFTETVLLFF